MALVPEASYPVTFRAADAARLGELISHHTSAVLIGMKRVGINNFLRFFLHHPTTRREFVPAGGTVMYITVDLNDLVEREMYPFWILVLKRVLDSVDISPLPDVIKDSARHHFIEAIQIKDLFLTIESIKSILVRITQEGIYPVLIFNRFDRMTYAITPEFFANLLGLREACGHKLSFIFTSWRPLSTLVPEVFTRAETAIFSRDIYLLPATESDSESIVKSFCLRYRIKLTDELTGTLITLSGGHVQYLQLGLIKIHESPQLMSNTVLCEKALYVDEQILLQSDELFENLTDSEKSVLLGIAAGTTPSSQDREVAKYLWDVGMIDRDDHIFSPLLSHFISMRNLQTQSKNSSAEFTKKELMLMTVLRAHAGIVVERDDIVSEVWPEVADLAVSDWAIDRLVSRVRTKLRQMGSTESIETVVTRGYKLVHHL